MAFGLKCPECRKVFKYQPLDGHPRYCPLCKADIGGNDGNDDVISIPAFLSARAKATDQVYRDLERTSEANMYKAAEMAGCDASDMANMKVTNIRDARKPGEIAAVPVVNSVTAHMDAMERAGMPTGFNVPNAAELAGQVRSGPHPNAGAKTLGAIQRSLGKL